MGNDGQVGGLVVLCLPFRGRPQEFAPTTFCKVTLLFYNLAGIQIQTTTLWWGQFNNCENNMNTHSQTTLLDHTLYDLTQQTQGAIWRAMLALRQQKEMPPAPPPHPLLTVQRSRAESAGWWLIQAKEFAPEPLTVPKLRRRAIYTAPRMAQALLDLMVAAGWLDRSLDEQYKLTQSGKDVTNDMLARSLLVLAELNDQLITDVERLVEIFAGIIGVWLTNSAQDSYCLTSSRCRAPKATAPLIGSHQPILCRF